MRPWLALLSATWLLSSGCTPRATPPSEPSPPAASATHSPSSTAAPPKACTDVGRLRLDPTSPLQVECATGELALSMSSATDLSMLEGLRHLDGDLLLDTNDGLATLRGLESLEEITGSLLIYENDSLETLEGLSALRRIGGSLEFLDNHHLRTLDGLSALDEVGGSVIVSVNDRLVNLSALHRLQHVAALSIHGNAALPHLHGLEVLTTIDGELYIKGNDALVDVDGLSGLRTVGGRVLIRRNPSLTSLEGLAGLEQIEPQTTAQGKSIDLTIEDNPALSSCAARAFAERLGAACKCSGNEPSDSCT